MEKEFATPSILYSTAGYSHSPPVGTLIGVQALATPGLLIKIEALAVVA
jgi:hypothetical protein